jgi:hypothetical protein
MHIPALLNHNMLRYNDMFDDILLSKSSHTEFVLASEEKRQRVVEKMLSAIINHLTDTATEQIEWGLTVGTPHTLIPEQERRGYGTPG